MKVFQIRQDDRFAWYETDQEQMERMVNVCGWQGRVLELAKEDAPVQTGLPKWIDDQKGSDPNTDALIEYIEQLRGDLPVQQPAPVAVLTYLCDWLDKLPRRQIKDSQTHSYIAADNVEALVEQARAALAAPVAAPVAMPAASVQPVVGLAAERVGRVYIAGPMTGIADYNFPAFNALAASMRADGWHVENPAEHGIVEGADWADYLRHDIARIATCDTIMLLPGWAKSKGAKLEVHIAQQIGMDILLSDGAESVQPDSGRDAALEEAAKVCESLYSYPDENGSAAVDGDLSEAASRIRALATQDAPEVASVPDAGDEPFGWVLVTPLHTHFEAGKLNPYKDDMGAFPLYTRPQPAPAVLSDEQIKAVATSYATHLGAANYDVTKYDCEEDFFNCVRAVLAAAGKG